MIVVSNTSPLTNLAAIEQFQLLSELYHQIHIPEGVWQELNAQGHHWPGRNSVAGSAWIQKHQVEDTALVLTLQRDLDQGEAEAIALAVALKADLVLMDETDGRRAAQRLGLRCVGVLGILLEAKASQLIDRVYPHLLALRKSAGFYLSNDVYRLVLDLAGEEPG